MPPGNESLDQTCVHSLPSLEECLGHPVCLSPVRGSSGQEEALEVRESLPWNTGFALGLPLWQGPAWTLLEGWPSACCYTGQDKIADTANKPGTKMVKTVQTWKRLCETRALQPAPLQFLLPLTPPQTWLTNPALMIFTPSPYFWTTEASLCSLQAPFVGELFKVPTPQRLLLSVLSSWGNAPNRNASLTAGWHLLRNVWTVPAYAPWGSLCISGHFSSCSGGWGCLSPTGSWAASRFMSRAVECGGRDPGLRPPRLESFVLRSLYGCVRLHRGLESVFVPCLGSQWEGNRPRGYITLQPSAFQNTTQSGEAQPRTFRVSGTGPEMWLRFQQLWHFPV